MPPSRKSAGARARDAHQHRDGSVATQGVQRGDYGGTIPPVTIREIREREPIRDRSGGEVDPLRADSDETFIDELVGHVTNLTLGDVDRPSDEPDRRRTTLRVVEREQEPELHQVIDVRLQEREHAA